MFYAEMRNPDKKFWHKYWNRQKSQHKGKISLANSLRALLANARHFIYRSVNYGQVVYYYGIPYGREKYIYWVVLWANYKFGDKYVKFVDSI